MANYPQELAQGAVCRSHTGRMTGLWFLQTRPLRLNTNERIYIISNMSSDRSKASSKTIAPHSAI